MKKKWIIGICCGAAALLAATGIVAAQYYLRGDSQKLLDAAVSPDEKGKTVAAVVNGDKLYEEEINFLMVGNQISQKSINDYERANGKPVTSEKSVDREHVLQDMIRETVERQEGERLGLKGDYEKAYQYTVSNYELAKESNNQEAVELVDAYMKKMNMSEKEYLESTARANQEEMTRAHLYTHFIEGKTGTEEELKQQYKEYVDQLVAKADITYSK